MDWNELAQDKHQWRALVIKVINLLEGTVCLKR